MPKHADTAAPLPTPRRATFHANAAGPEFPPPPPRRVIRQHERATGKSRAPEIVINWAAVASVCFFSALFLLIGIAIGAGIVSDAARAAIGDPFNGVPACTEEIANAGGICHGEPR